MPTPKNGSTRVIWISAVALLALASTFRPASAAVDEQQGDIYQTTQAYVSQFYPLWFTFNQTRFAQFRPNIIIGPDKISPIYHYVVAINNDTVYASSFLDLSAEPVVLDIPETNAHYSVLTLDPYCDIFQSAIKPPAPGKFVLYGPGFKGSLPDELHKVPVPFDYITIIFRADKFTNGVDMTSEAEVFRQSLHTAPLCAYLGERCPDGVPLGGDAAIVPEILFAVPFKTTADTLIAVEPIAFLRQLQHAVLSPRTPPMSPKVQALSNRFNALFARVSENRAEFARGAQAAHYAIVNNYLNHLGRTNWITYDNIGDWGPHVVQRSSITEFIQYANDRNTAAYYHAFKDQTGAPLNGTDPKGYVLTFSPKEIPETTRFWSLTAYTPEAIELVPNSADKYLVASYIPPHANPDGSISIYLARQRPAGVLDSNWLPIPFGPFNVMLRDYGPAGDVARRTYVPPGILKAQ